MAMTDSLRSSMSQNYRKILKPTHIIQLIIIPIIIKQINQWRNKIRRENIILWSTDFRYHQKTSFYRTIFWAINQQKL